MLWLSCGLKAHVFQAHDSLNRASIGRRFLRPKLLYHSWSLPLPVRPSRIDWWAMHFLLPECKIKPLNFRWVTEVRFLPEVVDAHTNSWNLLNNSIRQEDLERKSYQISMLPGPVDPSRRDSACLDWFPQRCSLEFGNLPQGLAPVVLLHKRWKPTGCFCTCVQGRQVDRLDRQICPDAFDYLEYMRGPLPSMVVVSQNAGSPWTLRQLGHLLKRVRGEEVLIDSHLARKVDRNNIRTSKQILDGIPKSGGSCVMKNWFQHASSLKLGKCGSCAFAAHLRSHGCGEKKGVPVPRNHLQAIKPLSRTEQEIHALLHAFAVECWTLRKIKQLHSLYSLNNC